LKQLEKRMLLNESIVRSLVHELDQLEDTSSDVMLLDFDLDQDLDEALSSGGSPSPALISSSHHLCCSIDTTTDDAISCSIDMATDDATSCSTSLSDEDEDFVPWDEANRLLDEDLDDVMVQMSSKEVCSNQLQGNMNECCGVMHVCGKRKWVDGEDIQFFVPELTKKVSLSSFD
jgi:hypothetical protein